MLGLPNAKKAFSITTLTKRMIISDWVIGGTLLLTLIWNGACSLFAPGWIAASLITGIDWLIFVGYSLIHRDRLVAKIMLLALVSGWVELLADGWLVDATQTLVYHPGGPFVLFSPLYMPFAWGVVMTQTGYVGWRLIKLKGREWAIFLTAMLGAATIPLYEWWAKGAMWWFYQNTRMWGVIPPYIILAEFFIAGGLVLLVYRMEERAWWLAPLLGVILGFWIWACYGISFSLVG
jgi:Domain of unknown function (DUF6989)